VTVRQEPKALKVDLRVPVGRPVSETADFIRACEDAGFDGVGVHDHPRSGRDAYIILTLAASRTSRIRLYPATSNPVSRHPLELASLAHSLEEVAPGRVHLTLAPGFVAVRSVGRPRAAVEGMREAVIVVRRLLAGGAAAFGTMSTRLGNTSVVPTPVYLLAAGPRMVELAGEVADGVLLMVGLHRDAIASARRHLAARAGREARDIPVIFIATIALDDRNAGRSTDGPDARRWPRRWFAPGHPWLTYPSRANLYWLRQAGLDVPQDPRPDEISDDLAERICDAFGLFGTAEHCAERLLRAQAEAGIGHVFLFPAHTQDDAYAMPLRERDAFARTIRRRLGG
jgi:5,10-methylenetetrahydromethanopterin reductase